MEDSAWLISANCCIGKAICLFSLLYCKSYILRHHFPFRALQCTMSMLTLMIVLEATVINGLFKKVLYCLILTFLFYKAFSLDILDAECNHSFSVLCCFSFWNKNMSIRLSHVTTMKDDLLLAAHLYLFFIVFYFICFVLFFLFFSICTLLQSSNLEVEHASMIVILYSFNKDNKNKWSLRGWGHLCFDKF